MSEVTERATLPELLDFCNRVREAGGANLLSELIPSEPSNPNECLIANALNFNCAVDGSAGNEGWAMYVDSREVAQAIVDNVPECECPSLHYGSDLGEEGDHFENEWQIYLPYEIGNVAAAFDQWMDALPGTQEYEDTEEFTPYVSETFIERRREQGLPIERLDG